MNLKCTPKQTYVCAGDEVICFCTALCNETIMWSGNTTPSFSLTQICNSQESILPPVRGEVIDSPSCSDNFTSRLSYNATLRMGSSDTIIQIDCSIVPDRPNSTTIPGCSPMTEPSHLERNSGFERWCVTNCTGVYVWIKQLHDNKIKCPNRQKSKPLTKGCFNCMQFTVAYETSAQVKLLV